MLALITDLGGHMDLSTITGLSEEQIASITAMHNTSTEGLRNKNTELLDEKSQRKVVADEQTQALDAARQAAVTAEELRLKADNDMDGLKTHYETQLAEKTASANESAKTAKDALHSRDKGDAMSQVMSLIHDDYKAISKAELSNIVKIGYNDQGLATTTYEYNGAVVANTIDEFKGWAAEQPQFKRILNGVDSSGADTTQSRGSASSTNKPYSELTLGERAKLNSQSRT